ncbi:MAG: hypothetical protein KBA32_09395 [Propionivibrio sp.]|jgi:hypothetical protein|uniref:hypothetical protein n=1 Tax=Propionivibrio sp. TaxID=2212460 RepID=UPI001B6E6456|nr:hypothetical protein [Propionivibrio sp.]MBP7203404.1 hypothetical protein [Propionivibrio sp.]
MNTIATNPPLDFLKSFIKNFVIALGLLAGATLSTLAHAPPDATCRPASTLTSSSHNDN